GGAGGLGGRPGAAGAVHPVRRRPRAGRRAPGIAAGADQRAHRRAAVIATDATAYELICQEALRRIEEDELDPARDVDAVRTAVTEAVEEYQRLAHLGEVRPLRDRNEMAERVVRSITQFGPLTELLSRPDVEQIFLEGPRVSYQ